MSALGLRRILLVLATVSMGLAASTAMAQRYGHGIHSHHRISSSYYGGYYGHRPLGRGVSVSIGGYPYGYGVGYGYGYRGLSYRGFGGYGLGGYGYSSFGYPYSGYVSAYRGYSPYYSSRVMGVGYYARPASVYVPSDAYRLGYRDGVAQSSYAAPLDSGENSRQPLSAAASLDSDSQLPADLRPGMVLPDGARVISVDPIGGK